ncbi:MAG: 30S ribosomal protein S17 [Bacteroidetes bacterium]|nr:30S ribosomal protein S17 [Bacteroidota bacterium]
MSEVKRSSRKERTGIVVSNKMDKTIVVGIQRQVRHPMYGKFIKKTSRLFAHDEQEEAREGDMVRVAEIRPLSKHKRWRLLEIVERAK